MKTPKSITIIGRTWRDSVYHYANTAATVLVDGVEVATVGPHQCSESHLIQEHVRRALAPHCGANVSPHDSLCRYCDRNGIAYHSEFANVARKRDL